MRRVDRPGGPGAEEKAYLFETWNEVEWSRATARYAWSIHRAEPSLEPLLVEAFGVVYHNVAQMDVDVRPRYAYIVDLALRLQPWLDDEAQSTFFARVPLQNKQDADFAVDVVDHLKVHAGWVDNPPDLQSGDPDQAEELERTLRPSSTKLWSFAGS